jgi:hypothetical protein
MKEKYTLGFFFLWTKMAASPCLKMLKPILNLKLLNFSNHLASTFFRNSFK